MSNGFWTSHERWARHLLSGTDLDVLVVGCGSIGRRHAHNLRTLGVGGIHLFDRDLTLTRSVAQAVEAAAYVALDQALAASPDAVLICTPPRSHLEVAEQVIQAGLPVFIEKPLA